MGKYIMLQQLLYSVIIIAYICEQITITHMQKICDWCACNVPIFRKKFKRFSKPPFLPVLTESSITISVTYEKMGYLKVTKDKWSRRVPQYKRNSTHSENQSNSSNQGSTLPATKRNTEKIQRYGTRSLWKSYLLASLPIQECQSAHHLMKLWSKKLAVQLR